jgi:hypothetical protein
MHEFQGGLDVILAFQALVAHNPKYVDCLLRLACIARVRGDTAQVEQLAQRALQEQVGVLVLIPFYTSRVLADCGMATD